MNYELFGRLAALMINILDWLEDYGSEEDGYSIRHDMDWWVGDQPSRLPIQMIDILSTDMSRRHPSSAFAPIMAAIKRGEAHLPMLTILRRAEYSFVEVSCQRFGPDQKIRLAKTPCEFNDERQQVNLVAFDIDEPLVVWKVDEINPNKLNEKIPVRHVQRLIISRAKNDVTEIFDGHVWMTEAEFKNLYPDSYPNVSWVSGFWFKAA